MPKNKYQSSKMPKTTQHKAKAFPAEPYSSPPANWWFTRYQYEREMIFDLFNWDQKFNGKSFDFMPIVDQELMSQYYWTVIKNSTTEEGREKGMKIFKEKIYPEYLKNVGHRRSFLKNSGRDDQGFHPQAGWIPSYKGKVE
jgi:hypothetical protein